MNKYRVEIIALNIKASDSLALQRKDEKAIKNKWSSIPKFLLPKPLKDFMKLRSEFIENEGGTIIKHKISGFSEYSEEHKEQFYKGVKNMMLENGCDINDFGVFFYDE